VLAVVASRFVQGRAWTRPGIGAAAGRDHHSPAGPQRPGANPHSPLAVQPAMTADQRDTTAFQPRHLPGIIQAARELVAAGQHRVHIELAGNGLCSTRDPAGLGQRLRGAQQRLGGHAGVVGALAADQL
jgi:hypothetical protein